MIPLTRETHIRRALAEHLAASCPPELGATIAITGSTARGLADASSDLEMNYWGETIPPVEARVAWLRDAGVEAIQVFPEPRPDDSYWIGGILDGVELEIGCQTVAALEGELAQLLSAQVTDPRRLALAELIVTAVPMRDEARVREWQTRLAQFPPELRAHFRDRLAERLNDDAHWQSLRSLAARGEYLALTRGIADDLEMALDAAYAHARQWMPSPKWKITRAEILPGVAGDAYEQIAHIFYTLAAAPKTGIKIAHGFMQSILDEQTPFETV